MRHSYKIPSILLLTLFLSLQANNVHADTVKSNQQDMPLKAIEIVSPLKTGTTPVPPIKSTKEILDKVKKDLETEKEKALKIKQDAEKAQEETDRIAQEKEAVAQEIEALRVRIAEAQAAIIAKQQQEALAAQAPVAQATPIAPSYQAQEPRAVVAGNGYAAGYCTYYVKNMRPDIGNFWGNANQWVSSAQAAGYQTGSEPRAGAIGVSFAGYAGHVVYVESVSGGTVNYSDMNGVAGFGAVGYGSAPSSSYVYIY